MSTRYSYTGASEALMSSAFELVECVRRYASSTDRRSFTVRIGPRDSPGDTKTPPDGSTVTAVHCEIIFIDEPGITAAEQADEFEAVDGSLSCTSTGADEVTCELDED